jgi:hypothetical protein
MSGILTYSEFSIAPVLKPVFDFTEGVMPAGASLLRASQGSRFTAAGLVSVEPINGPRFEHDPVTGQLRGLLIEVQATSQATQSENLAGWASLSGVTVQSDAEVAPSGAMTADRVVPSIDNLVHGIISVGMLGDRIDPAANDAVQFFARIPVELPVLIIEAYQQSARRVTWSFDTRNQTFTQLSRASDATIVSAAAKQLPSGWWLFNLIVNAAPRSIRSYSMRFSCVPAPIPAQGFAGQIFAGDGVANWSVWGLQAEQAAAVSSSYIPTAGATATRAADVLTLDWASRGLSDGTINVRYTFDDLTTQDGLTTIAVGKSIVPNDLNRRILRRVERV